jgi:6-phosphogluconolactonase
MIDPRSRNQHLGENSRRFFMKPSRRVFLASSLTSSTALVLGSSTLPAADATKYWVFIGPYTAKGGSEGIYRCSFDTNTGKLGQPELAAKATSPSFLNVSADSKFLYAVGETAGGGKRKGGGVMAFKLDAATGQITLINSQDTLGGGPCHVSVDPSGKLVFVANYGGGSSCAYKVNADGGLSESIAFHQYEGKSVNTSRQEKPHTHCTMFNNAGTHCFIVDLGIDKVMVHPVQPNEGKVAAAMTIDLPTGSGPRHIAINSDDTIAYVNGELDMTVNVVKLDLKAGKFEVLQSLSTVPEGKPMPGYSTAEVRIHPNGKFVYVSNRGQNSIAAFAVQAGGKLKAIGHITGAIKTPRNFNIDPSGQWMLIANQDGDTVRVYKLDPKTGLATETDSVVKVAKPVCVKFVAMKS